MLLEALISIAIFSIGVLGLIGLQAAAIKNADDARQRAVAAFYGNQLISRMWADDRANLADYAHQPDMNTCPPLDPHSPPPFCRRGIRQSKRHQLACRPPNRTQRPELVGHRQQPAANHGLSSEYRHGDHVLEKPGRGRLPLLHHCSTDSRLGHGQAHLAAEK
jgi:hypothetical protein